MTLPDVIEKAFEIKCARFKDGYQLLILCYPLGIANEMHQEDLEPRLFKE
jgi:hypothetical protein